MATKRKGQSLVVVTGPLKKGGAEVWRISANGQFKTFTTSATSTVVMDKVVAKYAPALRRLADK